MLDRVTPRGKLKEEIVAILRMLLREPPDRRSAPSSSRRIRTASGSLP